MQDDFYKKQLEAFGVESTQIVRGDLNVKRAQDRHEAAMAVIKALMERIEGRQWLYAQLDMCRTFTTPFVAGRPDVSDFLCGLQAYGHTLLADIMEASPAEYYVMIAEEGARKRLAASTEG